MTAWAKFNDEFESKKGPHGHYGEEGYKYITEWPVDKRIYMVENYFNFIFVRHPLERLLSAYRDKVTQYRRVKFHKKIRFNTNFFEIFLFLADRTKLQNIMPNILSILTKKVSMRF